MSSHVTRMVGATAAAFMLQFAVQAAAEHSHIEAAPQDTVVVEAGATLIPERWCVESHMLTPSLATRFSLRDPTRVSWSGSALSIYDFQLIDGVTDRSTLSYRLAEFDSDRIVTFWQSDSLGLFLGVSDGGFLRLSIAGKKH
ncbi:MAG: hypothetical protein L0Y45_06505 [Woeseiaceae bacterium]|nr:hypothetical protein [Woeseiaceae bacterium]